jgi:serine/threonine protein kinase/Tol biopolymer transport system component
MTPERWQQIRNVLQQALELAPEQRSAFVARSCSADHALRQEVETLLDASEEARSSFLESSTLQVTLTPGTKLGDYEVQKLIGSGGMGEVYRARDLRLKRDVAIKVLPSFFSSDKERLRRFEQEAQATAALNHPNILAIFQMGTYQGAPYLVSELLEGETLREEIRRGSLPARKAIEQAAQIARGLAAAHEKGIVHRDLKPENLFATKDGRIKILDFGLAKLKQQPARKAASAMSGAEGTEPGMVMGTAGYMSPEQVRGKPADHRTDIFAFGAILYEMLSQRRAFQKPTSAETMNAILNEEPAAVSQISREIPPALQRTVHRCLEKSPEQRFQSASDLAFALEALSDSSVTPASARFAVSSRRRDWRLVVRLLGLVLVLAGIVAWLWWPPAVPVVVGVRQLTDDGIPKLTNPILTDGLRIYFGISNGAFTSIDQVSVAGGQSSPLPTRFAGLGLIAILPDASALLLNAGEPSGLWLQPLPGGEAKSLATGDVDGGESMPDGRIVFVKGADLFIAEKDGTNSRKLVSAPGHISCPRSSPDGRRIRFTLASDKGFYSIWEITSDGAGLHEVFKRQLDSMGERAGNWTQDGKYFVFQVEHRGLWDLWAYPEKVSPFRHAAPVQLTNGPLSYEEPLPSRKGNEVFAIGSKKRGELIQYDAKSSRFISYLSSVSAISSRVSRDGKWVVYVTYPEHTLWRCRPDGSERQQLTFPPMMVYYPEISPDSSKVAFSAATPESLVGIYVIDLDGGKPQKKVDWGHAPAWSPDGNSLAFAALVPGAHLFERGRWLDIDTIDLRTNVITRLPSKANHFNPWWPRPDVILADAFDVGSLERFDLKQKTWTHIGTSSFYVNWTASPDGKFLYLLNSTAAGAKVQRIRASDFKIEDVATLGDTRLINDDTLGEASLGGWIGVAADGSPTLTRDVGSDEIYALDVKWP